MFMREAKAGAPELLPSHRHKQEVRVWALILLLGVATLVAGCILWAKISGI